MRRYLLIDRMFPLVAFLLVAFLLCSGWWSETPASEPTYGFELLGRGAVIARDGPKTGSPCVVRVPEWVPASERADPTAEYYLYYGTHHGDHIHMKWAESIEGPWTEYNLCGRYNGRCRRGVFDITADSAREEYGHITMPNVHVDQDQRRFIMFYHGENQPATTTSGGTKVPQVHQNFVATSKNGLNFHDPRTAGGQPGHGPKTVKVDDVTRDIWIGPAYQHAFRHRGNWYSLSKRAILAKAPDPDAPFAANPADPFGQAWEIERTPEKLWYEDASKHQAKYHSPAATFLASSEFANHPNNPNPGVRILSSNERINHVSCCLLPDDKLEIIFYVRKDPDDRYRGLYRLLYDLSDPDFENWEVARDASGQVIFEATLTPEEVAKAVQTVNPGANPIYFADPISFGDSWIFVDDDGSKYLFFSYVSQRFSGADGEGQITAVRLIPTR